VVRHERYAVRNIGAKDNRSSLAASANWIMCILYTSTFGSFIGYAAGFPLLMKTQFPDVDVFALRLS
jgi:NNP family nitrate/nitrite transporter-like MFS transporter